MSLWRLLGYSVYDWSDRHGGPLWADRLGAWLLDRAHTSRKRAVHRERVSTR